MISSTLAKQLIHREIIERTILGSVDIVEDLGRTDGWHNCVITIPDLRGDIYVSVNYNTEEIGDNCVFQVFPLFNNDDTITWLTN